MEKKLSFAMMLSLEEISLRRSVINMWCETDVLLAIRNRRLKLLLRDPHPGDFVITLMDIVKEKISNLHIPEQLKKRMTDIVIPIGTDILRWKAFHENIFNCSPDDLSMEIIKRLCWTSTGSVDYRRTADKILCLDALEVRTRYKIAALYCLVDYIPALWEQLPKSCKRYYLPPKNFWASKVEMSFYWANILAKGESKLDDIAAEFLPENVTFHQHAIECSAISRNKAAVEYFFQKLTEEERNAFLVPLVYKVTQKRDRDSHRRVGYFPFEKLSEVLCYLLLQMRPEQQLEVLMEKPCKVLSCLLEWPSQDVFLEIADVMWAFISETQCLCLIMTVARSIVKSRFYFSKFIQEFFLRVPPKYKKLFCRSFNHTWLFFTLFFGADDTITIKNIFRDLDVIDKLRLVKSTFFIRFSDMHVMEDEIGMVKLCLQLAIPSRKYKSKIKRRYLRYLTSSHVEQKDKQLRKRKWLQIFRDIGKTNVSLKV